MLEDKSNTFLVPSIIYNIEYFLDSLVKMPIAKIAEWIINRRKLCLACKAIRTIGHAILLLSVIHIISQDNNNFRHHCFQS